MTITTQKTSLFFKLSISITVFGGLIQYLSWPLILLGAFGMVTFHSIDFFQKQNKSTLDYLRQLLIVAFLGNSLFSVFQFEYANILTIVTKTILIIFLIAYIKEVLFSVEKSIQEGNLFSFIDTEKLSRILADISTIYIIVASFLKILNWKAGIINANFLLVVGLLAALTSILTSSKILNK